MKQVIFVKNVCRETPGLFEKMAIERKIPYSTISLENGEEIPNPSDTIGALVIMGGPDSANDPSKKILHELEQVQKYLQLKIPYYGVCLGMQILGKAAGERISKNQIPEIGFRNPEGKIFTVQIQQQNHPLFVDLPESFRVFQLHNEMVEVSEKCQLLATSKYCPAQVISAAENAFGVQFHTEIIPELFTAWMQEDADLKKINSTDLLEDYQKYWPEMEQTTRMLFGNFLRIAGY